MRKIESMLCINVCNKFGKREKTIFEEEDSKRIIEEFLISYFLVVHDAEIFVKMLSLNGNFAINLVKTKEDSRDHRKNC